MNPFLVIENKDFYIFIMPDYKYAIFKTNILAGDTRRTTSELPVTHF